MTTQNKITGALFVFSGFCTAMEALRIHCSHNVSFIFLIWNLILAWVPYLLSLGFMKYDTALSKIASLGLLILWILFLPNGPYIITDLLHVRQRETIPMWYDVMLVSTFAWNGLLLTLLSVGNVHRKLQGYLSPITLWMAMPILFLSSGYGIYVGRFLRWNSWDVFFRPFYLLRCSMAELLHPFQHPQPIYVSVVICSMLSLSYMIFYLISHKPKIEHEIA